LCCLFITRVGIEKILPNEEPYIPTVKKKVTIVFGKPIYFDELIKEMKMSKKTPTEMRKLITDCIQEEFYKLKEVSQKFHDEHLKS